MKKPKTKRVAPKRQETGLNGALNYFSENIIKKRSADAHISHLQNVSIKRLKPLLIGKRGSRVSETIKCGLCGNIANQGWKYTIDESSVVLLCQHCKEKAKPSRVIKSVISTPMKS